MEADGRNLLAAWGIRQCSRPNNWGYCCVGNEGVHNSGNYVIPQAK